MIRNLANSKNYSDALRIAFEAGDTVLVEEMIHGEEYRFLVMDQSVIGIIKRIPANVIGDGKSSIRELIEKKNNDPIRGTGYRSPLQKINLGDIERFYLEIQGRKFESILSDGEQVFLRENSNISNGGDSIDFTDVITDEYKRIAIDAVNAIGAKICGADLIINNLDEKPTDNNHAIIELNFNPAIHIHTYPYKGENREPAKKILDILGF